MFPNNVNYSNIVQISSWAFKVNNIMMFTTVLTSFESEIYSYT